MRDSIVQYVIQPIIAGVFAIIATVTPVIIKVIFDKNQKSRRVNTDRAVDVALESENATAPPLTGPRRSLIVPIATLAILLDLISIVLAISAIQGGVGVRRITGVCSAVIGAAALVGAIVLNLITSQTKGDRHSDTLKRKLTAMRTSPLILSVGAVAGVSTGLGLLLAGFNPVHAYTSTGPVPLEAPVAVTSYYVPAYMGEDVNNLPNHIKMNSQLTVNCHPDPTCVRFQYIPGGFSWAGVYWLPQGTGKVWGDHPGRKIEGAVKLGFWARGESGGELIKFEVGGITSGTYHDSLDVVMDPNPVALTTQWQKYEIDLKGADMSSVVGAFAWSAATDGNPHGATFYLDGIRFE